ncbi:DUF3369 domain-containing protein [Fusibacter sp. JL216-2]|uniref:DUF3369 domain-containing protein n=1 Tax=Fusibacter sp. JL216-2 TaxID=3071453 RepID=UPI003D357E22
MFDNDRDDLLVFKDEEPETLNLGDQEDVSPWKVLIVDDEDVVHNTTKLVLHDFKFEGKAIAFISAYSSKEAKKILNEVDDIAVVFLDVVMEEEDAGLQLVRYIREDLQNNLLRIILRTGQPGQAPEERVIIDYDINDYKTKTELTVQKLFTSLVSALRSYKDLVIIEKNRQGLHKIVEASNRLFEINSLKQFTAGLIMQMISMYGLEDEAIYYRQPSGMAAAKKNGHLIVLAGCGEFEEYVDKEINEVANEEIMECIQEAKDKKAPVFRENIFVGYYKSLGEIENYIVFKGVKEISNIDRELINLFSTNISVAFDNVYLNERILSTQKEVIYRLGEVVESRSKETANHVRRVAEMTYLLAIKFGLTEQEADMIRMAAPMHDVGKIGISENILNKAGPLTDEEFGNVKKHTDIGYEILKDSKLTLMDAASTIARHHHENWDGSGYPQGLKGEDIPLIARIVALADVFDSLCHERVYKEAWPINKAVAYIEAESGRKFDPTLVKIFIDSLDDVKSILKEMKDKEYSKNA